MIQRCLADGNGWYPTAHDRKMARDAHVEHSEGFIKASSVFLDGLPILDKPPNPLESRLGLPMKNVLPDLV
jgi:hypothetical protein